jgi:hypothetical protein
VQQGLDLALRAKRIPTFFTGFFVSFVDFVVKIGFT